MDFSVNSPTGGSTGNPGTILRVGEGIISEYALRKRLAEQSLYHYVKEAWRIVEPMTVFQDNWHIRLICQYLEKVTRREILKTVLNEPPRTMKSLLVSVFWPTWVWIREPHVRWLFSSYDGALSIRDAVKSRRIMESSWYQERWGNKFKMTSDQNVKSRYENDKTGYRISTSVGGVGTGEGADLLIVDDAHNVKDSESGAVRLDTLSWWDQAFANRINDPARSARLIVGQRVHHEDLCGHVLSKERDWNHIVLPMEYEAGPGRDYDPRTGEEELLWPSRFDKKYVEAEKTRLGSYGFAGQHQQRPAPREGGIVKLGWFRRYRSLPENKLLVIQSWDTAQKAKDINDPWAGGTFLVTPEGYFLAHVLRRHMEYPEGKHTAIAYAEQWRPDAILIEDKGNGTALIQEMRSKRFSEDGVGNGANKAGQSYPVIAVNPETDKIIRMSAESPAIEAGMVWLPYEADWLVDFEQEISVFPLVSHDDQVDMLSQFLRWIKRRQAEIVLPFAVR